METEFISNLLFKASDFLAFPFERNFEPTAFVQFAKDHPIIPVVAVASYLSICFFGKKVMASRKAFDLRLVLALWNAFLSLFSFVGMCRTVSFCVSS